MQNHRFLSALAAVFVALLPLAGVASDGVRSDGPLTDKEYYRLITCGAPPGGTCQGPIVRWAKPVVTVSLPPAAKGYPPKLAARVDKALNHAIDEINRAGSGLHLRRDDGLRNPDIFVLRPDMVEGDRTRNIPRMPDGEPVGVGFMWIWWDDARHLSEGSLLITKDITTEDLQSVVLEELFQCLGFLFDIENPDYEGVSIVAQDSNATTRITGQDRAILRLHYPAN